MWWYKGANSTHNVVWALLWCLDALCYWSSLVTGDGKFQMLKQEAVKKRKKITQQFCNAAIQALALKWMFSILLKIGGKITRLSLPTSSSGVHSWLLWNFLCNSLRAQLINWFKYMRSIWTFPIATVWMGKKVKKTFIMAIMRRSTPKLCWSYLSSAYEMPQ